MIRIAFSSLLTLAVASTIHATSDTTPYILIAMLFAAGFSAGAFIMYAATAMEVK